MDFLQYYIANYVSDLSLVLSLERILSAISFVKRLGHKYLVKS